MIYFVISAILFVCGLLSWVRTDRWLEAFILFVTCSSLILLCGLRGNIEADYSSYLDIFTSSKQGSFSAVGVEPLYFYFNKFIAYIGLPFQTVIFTMALLSLPPKCFFFYENSPNFVFSILVYYSTTYFLFDFIQIRQGLTIAIFIYSLKFILSGNFKRYFICILIASTIHISALLLIPCYFILRRTYSLNFLYACIVVCAFVNILKINVPLVNAVISIIPIPEMSAAKVAHYSASDEFSGSSFKQLFLGFIFVFISKKQTSQVFLVLMKIFILGLLFSTIFNEMPELAFRIKWYFLWSEAILVVYLVEYFSFNSLLLKILLYTTLSMMYCISMYSLLHEISTRGDYIFPYRFFNF